MPSYLSGQIAVRSTRQAARNLEQLVQAVPDRQTGFRPSPLSRTPIELIAHCATSNLLFAATLSGSTPPYRTEEERDRAEAACTTISASLDLLSRSVEEFCMCVAELTEDRLAEEVAMPWGERIPMAQAILVSSAHMQYHEGQLALKLQLLGIEDA